MNTNISTLLLVGIDLVGLAKSARSAGYKVYAADYFGDVDLQKECHECLSILQNYTDNRDASESTSNSESIFDPYSFVEMVKSLSEKEQMDAILLSSGLDDSFDVLHKLNKIVNIIGNNPQTFQKVRDRNIFFRELKRLRISHPHTTIVTCLDEAKNQARDLGFPVILKPLEGFAGVGIRKADDQHQLEKMFPLVKALCKRGAFIQEYIEGTHASISFLASKSGARVLSINEQLLGLSAVYQPEPFGYCGNIVPLEVSHTTESECRRIIENISSCFGLKGSNGIDIVISKDETPYVIEVNPRFQGTLECIEQILGVNLVRIHIDACLHDSLPNIIKHPSTFSTRLILYSPRRITSPDLTPFIGIRDIPPQGTHLNRGDPFCSIISKGKTREMSMRDAMEKATLIYKML